RERPGVAELVVEVERVQADSGRQEEEWGEPPDFPAAARPEEIGERRQEREAHHPRPYRKAARNARKPRPPALRAEEGRRGEGEEEAVRVEGGEHEGRRKEREDEDAVPRPVLAEEGPDDLEEAPRPEPGGD